MDASTKIPCTLVPTNKHNLLLPNSAIAEVLICDKLEPMKKKPHWLLGSIKWQEENVSIIAFDQIDENGKTKLKTKNTIVIIRNTSENPNLPFFGILVKSIPQIIEANSHNIDRNLHPQHPHPHAKSYININNSEALIPDIETLAKAIEEAK